MRALFAMLGVPFSRLPFCSRTGAIAGSLAGFLMALFLLENPTMMLNLQQLVMIGILLGITGLLWVLLFFGLLLQYGVGQIFWPAFANALAAAILTVLVAYWLEMPAAAGLVGLLIGILVGALLCWLCHVSEVLWLCRVSEGRPDAKT